MTKFVVRRVPDGRLLPVIRTGDGLALYTGIYSHRDPDELSEEEAIEVTALIATGRYERIAA